MELELLELAIKVGRGSISVVDVIYNHHLLKRGNARYPSPLRTLGSRHLESREIQDKGSRASEPLEPDWHSS